MSAKGFFLMGLVAALPMIGMAAVKSLSHSSAVFKPAISTAAHSGSTAGGVAHSAATAGTHSAAAGSRQAGPDAADTAARTGAQTASKNTGPSSHIVPEAVRGISENQGQRERQWSAILQIAKEQESAELARRAGFPNESVLRSQKVTKGVAHFVSIPQNRHQYQQIFGISVNDEALETTIQTGKKFHALGALDMPSSPEALERYLFSRQETVITFTGHNEAGVLKLAGASRIPLQTMADICARKQKICVFLTCSSRAHVQQTSVGVPLTITYDDASRLISLVESFHAHAAKEGATYADFTTSLPVILAVENMKTHARLGVRYIAPVAAVGAGLFIISATDQPPQLSQAAAERLQSIN